MLFTKLSTFLFIISATLLTVNASPADRRNSPQSALHFQKVNKCRNIIRNEYMFCKAFLKSSGNEGSSDPPVTITRTDSYVVIEPTYCAASHIDTTRTETLAGTYTPRPRPGPYGGGGKRSLASPANASPLERRTGALWSLLAAFSNDIIKEACILAFPELAPSKTVSVLPTYTDESNGGYYDCGISR